MINNDRWSALSMKDRAALIDIYVKSGITDLGEIRKDYNSFDYGGYTESPVDMGELEAAVMTPKQSRINKRRMRKELFTKIKSVLESNGDIIQLYNSLPDDQRKRALESVMKFSSAADPKIVKDWFMEEAKKRPLKAIRALDYVITGDGQPVLFEPNRKYAYNGLFGGDYYFDKQTPIDNGIVDAMLYNREINPDIGVQADKQDYGPEVDYINRVYPNKNVQYIETRPGTNLNQENIQSTIYYGAQGSFKTSLPKRVINNQGIIIQEGIRNDSTFVRGLDVYDFKPDEYTTKWVSDSSMFPIIKQIDEDTNPVAIKTPWVYKDNINDIISSRTGLNGFEFNTIDSDKSVYKTQKALGGKLNKFETGGPIEPIYYDDTYIEPAVVKAFNSAEEYNRYQGRKGAEAVRRGMNKAANTISEGLRYTPVVGDVMDGLEAYEEAKTGNLTKAGVLAGLTLLPNALEKPVKAVSKPLKRYLTHGIDNDLFTLSMKKWKGSPMPSMSVNDLDIPIFDYGDMTFIGSEDLLDNSIIFRGDGLTPTIGTVGGNEMMDPQEVIKRMKEQQKRKGEYNIGQIISKEEASILPMRGGTEDYFEAKYQDFIPWNKFKHLVTKGELHPDLIKLIEDIGIPHTNVPEENYLEAIRKIAEEMNLVFNKGGKLNKFVTGGPVEQNVDSNWLKSFKELPDGYKKAVLQLVTDLNYNVKDAESLYNSGKLKAVIEAKYQNTPLGRVRQNDSPTSTESSNLEKKMNKILYNSTDRVLPNMKYAIPYIEELEIKVPGVGRTTTNALDSLAKYAVQAQIPLSEALGLSAQETAFGALPQYNYVEIVGTEEEKQKARDFNRALGNSSYFRNYGIIPAENFVRDFRYNIVEDPIDRDVPPLLHAFNYWKKGNYNRGDSDHTKDVKAKGEAVMKTKVIQDWINNSKFAQKALNLSK